MQRVFVLCHKYYDGKAPRPANGSQDVVLWSAVHASVERRAHDVDRFRFRDALASAMNVARRVTNTLTDTGTVETGEDRPGTRAHDPLQQPERRGRPGVVLEPFLPFTAGRLRSMLSLDA